MNLTTEQLKKLKDAYKFQKSYSKRRVDRNGDPIGWELTFESWLRIWQESGHLANRGTFAGGYVMSRKGDIGPYSEENVRIILHAENIKEKFEYWSMSDDQKKHLSDINMGKTHSDELKAKLSEIHKKRWAKIDKSKLNWKPSQETLAKMRKPRGPRPTTTCPHCNTTGAVASLKRYHFDNCKLK